MLKTVKEVATELGVHQQTVYRWIKSGKLESIKIGGAVRIEEYALYQFIHKGGKDVKKTS